jgi:hypothetical protein
VTLIPDIPTARLYRTTCIRPLPRTRKAVSKSKDCLRAITKFSRSKVSKKMRGWTRSFSSRMKIAGQSIKIGEGKVFSPETPLSVVRQQ